MRVFVGTSGFAYKPWKGRFYPKELPDAKMLSFYASRFDACEINGSYYRLPAESVLTSWAHEVPPGFVFALKAPKLMTEGARWSTATMAKVVERSRSFGAARGPTFVRLPDALKKDARRLVAFLDGLPPRVSEDDPRVVIEFRDASWFDDEVFELLRAHDVALCWAESDTLATPPRSTARWGYLRLRKAHYDSDALQAWVDRIGAEGWSEAYVFFRHEDEARGTAFAAEMVKLLRRA